MADQPTQQRLAAVLAADVVGYTRLMEQDAEGTVAAWVSARDGVINPLVAEYSGRIVKLTGDGFLAEFRTVHEAVKCAMVMQEGFASSSIEFRIGINLGDIIDDGQDIHGEGVNVAARIESLASPGGVSISGSVYEQVRNRIDATYQDQGEQVVKNVSAPVRVFAIRPVVDAPASGNTHDILKRPAVAVLPFDNLSGDPDQEYFADGLTEDVITALSLCCSFPVIARNSTFTYKGTSTDIRKIGDELGARYVIEGSVRKAGDRLRVTAQLIDAESGHHVWAERYERRLIDIFDLQDELTQRIVATVTPELERAEVKRSVLNEPNNLDAWDAMQRGLSCSYEFNNDGYTRARKWFEQAINLDPSYARGHAHLAYNELRAGLFGFVQHQKDRVNDIVVSARLAVDLDEQDAFAQRTLAIAYIVSRNFDLAGQHFERALELNPSDAPSLIGLGTYMALTGNGNDAIPLIAKGLQLNPKDPANHFYFGFMARAQFAAQHYETAVEWANKAIQRKSDQPEPHLILAASLGQLGHSQEARSALETCLGLSSGYENPENWPNHFSDEIINDQFLSGLRDAGWEG